jgi:chemotaxis protein MotB
VAAYSTQDQRKMQIVAGSMREAFGTRKDSKYAGVVEQDGIPINSHLKNARQASPESASDYATPNKLQQQAGIADTAFDRSFALAAASLRQALQDMPEIAELSKNIIIEESKDGLNISLVDQDGRSMFPDGSTQPYDRTRRVLEALAPTMRRMPNRISVTGHTASPRPGTRPNGLAWDLSAGRAIAIREILAGNGLPDDRFAVVAGKADVEPMFPDNPYLAANRRVTVTLIKEAPPVPFGQRP